VLAVVVVGREGFPLLEHPELEGLVVVVMAAIKIQIMRLQEQPIQEVVLVVAAIILLGKTAVQA
jgi:hypothetical protein